MIIIGPRVPPIWHLFTHGREVHFEVSVNILYKNCTFITENTQI